MVVGLHFAIDAPLIGEIDISGGLVVLALSTCRAHGTVHGLALLGLSGCRLRRLDLDGLQDIEMHHFLPLSEYEVVFLEILAQELCRGLTMLHDNLAVLV